jgi:hypothetical protein
MLIPPFAAERLIAWSGAHPAAVGAGWAILLVIAWIAFRRLLPDPRLRFRVDSVPAFLTRAELEFFSVLRPVAAELDLVVFAKVGLNDIFRGARGGPRGQYSRYSQMHVDFLLVTDHDFRPVLGIEVDGDSHRSAVQRDRDRRKDAVFKAAGLPLLRFPNDAGLTHRDLLREVESASRRRVRVRV